MSSIPAAGERGSPPELSVVAPLYNESENVQPLVQWMLVAQLAEGYDLVCGWRQQRQDKLILRKVPSWVANRLIRRLTGVQITDNGCSLKAYRRDLLDRISLYAEQHRFIP